MSGLAFGKELKKWRIAAGLSSRELSQRVGKAVTYVSQLERGLIKTPDYATCYKLMKEVGFEEDERIQGILNWFQIMSAEQYEAEQAMLEQRIAEEERRMAEDPEGYAEYQWEQHMYYETVRLKDMSDKVYHSLNVMIDRDFSKAETVLENLEALMSTKERFDFFCSLFQFDYAHLPPEARASLLQQIEDFFTAPQQQGGTKE